MSSVKNLAQLFESIQSSSHSSLPTPPPSPYPYRQKKNNVTEVKSQEKEKKAKPLDLLGVNRKKLIEGLKLQLSSSKKPSDVKASTKEHEYTLDKEKSTVNANEGETHSPLDQSEETNKKGKLESDTIVKIELSSPPKTHRSSSELDLETKNLGKNSPNEIDGNVNKESPEPSSMAQNLGNPTPVIEELPKEKQTSPESKKKTEYMTNVNQQLSILVARARASFESCKKKTGEQVQNMREIGIKCCTSTKQIVVEVCSSSSKFLRKLPKVYARSFQIYCSSTPSTAKIALAVLLTSFICSLHPTVPRGSTPLLSFTYVQASTKVSFNYCPLFPFDT